MTVVVTDLRERLAPLMDRVEEAEHVSLCLDFDGTLTPIKTDPEAVSLDDDVRTILEQLGETSDLTLAIVSGRGLDDLTDRISIPGIAYAGNHGLEIHRNGIHWVHPAVDRTRATLERVRDDLATELEPIPGARVEDKGATLSVHFRAVEPAHKSTVVEITEERAGDIDHIRLESGKAVVQVRPDISWNKGDAVRLIAPTEPGTLVVFVGDDRTDVDAFDTLERLEVGTLAIGVGDRSLPGDIHLRDPDEVSTMLTWLAERA